MVTEWNELSNPEYPVVLLVVRSADTSKTRTCMALAP